MKEDYNKILEVFKGNYEYNLIPISYIPNFKRKNVYFSTDMLGETYASIDFINWYEVKIHISRSQFEANFTYAQPILRVDKADEYFKDYCNLFARLNKLGNTIYDYIYIFYIRKLNLLYVDPYKYHVSNNVHYLVRR